MSLRKLQTGFSAVEFIIIVVVVAALALVGYTVYNRQNNKTATTTDTQLASSETTANDVPSAPAISSNSDLDKASAMLDKVDPGTSHSSDASRLDSQLANF